MKVLLVCSSSAHLPQLMGLRPWWEKQETTLVASRSADAVTRLADQRVVWVRPTTASRPALIARELRLAWRVLYDVRPDVVIRTGDGAASTFSLMSRLFGVRQVQLEVFEPNRQSTRIPCTTTRFTNLGDARTGHPTAC